jgi:hypothetical protein
MQPQHIFLLIWVILAVFLISLFLLNGRKSLKKFPKLKKSEFEFIENWASGYATRSFKTKTEGARNVLRIRVTKNELWLTTNTFTGWIAEHFGVLHLIPINSLKSVEIEGKNIYIEFEQVGRIIKLVLISRKQQELYLLLRDKLKKGNLN